MAKTNKSVKAKTVKTQKIAVKKERRLTKTMAIFSALNRPEGATVEEIAEITGWQSHSVRGFLSTQKKKREDFALEKFTRGDGKTAYKIDITEKD